MYMKKVLIQVDNQHRILLKILTTINSFSTDQNAHHFMDEIFKSSFMNEKFCILIWILLKIAL